MFHQLTSTGAHTEAEWK